MHFRLLKNTNQIAGMPGTAFNGSIGQVANAEGLADPKLIDTAVIAELESLRATRAIEMAETGGIGS